MRVYTLYNYRSYRIFGQTIEPETELCEHSWVVFDEGAKDDVVTFGKNGTITEKKSGSCQTGKWSFEEGVKRLHVLIGKLDFVCVPVIFDEMMIAFEVKPGEVIFMVDQSRRHAFAPVSFDELQSYLKDFEQKSLLEVDERKRPEYQLYQSFYSTVDWGELQRRYKAESDRREARIHTPLMNILSALIVVALLCGLVALRGWESVTYVFNIFMHGSVGMQIVYIVGGAAILLLAFAIIRMFISGTNFSSRWIEEFADESKKAYLDSHPYLSERQVNTIRRIKVESFEREIR